MLEKISFKADHGFPFGYVDIPKVIPDLHTLKMNALILLRSCPKYCRDYDKEKKPTNFRRMSFIICGLQLITESCQGYGKNRVIFHGLFQVLKRVIS